MAPENVSPATARGGLSPLAADTAFLSGYTLLFIALMALMRGVLLYGNAGLAESIPPADLARAFGVGLRFDLMVACVPAAPLVIALLLPRGLGRRRLALWWLGSTGALTLFAGVTEIEFYREFHTRLNSIAFHYLQEDARTVSSMIWNGYPVVRYLLLWASLSAVYVLLLRWLDRRTRGAVRNDGRVLLRVPVVLLVLFLVAWGARGTLRSGPPLRWGDAFHSQHLFANHLALNGTFTLVKAAVDVARARDPQWLHAMPDQDATALTREMLLTAADELLLPEQYPLLRRHTPVNRLPAPPKNVVLIIMESFSAEFSGAFGHDHGITPEFDSLVQQGLLFDRMFSSGTHTHQGMFATVACFPNLPGYEYLMQQPEGQHQFSGLPVLLDRQGFNDLYVYNGHFAWDNQEGFFRNQGMSRFIGRDDFRDPVFIDATWGVSDQDMFTRALDELGGMPTDKPFYAVLQTLSNHTPYALPDDLPIEPVSGFGKLDEHLTAQRYSDWALGRFFATARQAPWFRDTLFVIVGDHGFPISRQMAEIDLLRFHVPLLLLGPGLRETYGAVNHTVATQPDVAPTIAGLLGEPFVHQCWGRDLLSLPADDPGVGVIKPSGSDQTVALITGDHVLVKPPHRDASLGRYGLGPTDSYQADPDPVLRDDLERRLGGFVQTAMRSLRDNRSGVPDSVD